MYFDKSTRPEIAQALHQCARFQADPKVEHGQAVKWIGRYLLKTKDKGMVLRPLDKYFDCYVEASFAGDFVKEYSEEPDMAGSRTGYVITYGGCPVIWASKLQTEVALSTTEAEYIALSQSLREVIPLMGLMREMLQHGFKVGTVTPRVHCEAFEDNSGTLIMAQEHNARPRTKHIAVKYHHFRHHLEIRDVTIHPISTLLQLADIFTKPLEVAAFEKHRKGIIGW